MSISAPTPQEQAAIKRIPLVTNNRPLSWITDKVSNVVEERTRLFIGGFRLPSPRRSRWWGLLCIAYQISTGVGVWGENHPNGWAWDITNFVFWIGIGHAGTLISAILFLTRQKWRTAVKPLRRGDDALRGGVRGHFPPASTSGASGWRGSSRRSRTRWASGRTSRSPLLWDVFAVSTYFTVSVLFWYTGLVPDLGTLRDRATSRIKKFLYGVFALGWRGANRQWRHYEMAYLLQAGPLDPARALGALGGVLRLRDLHPPRLAYHHLPALLRRGRHLRRVRDGAPPSCSRRASFTRNCATSSPPQHVDKMAKIICLTGSIVGYAYLMELFISWYSTNPFEKFTFFHARANFDGSGYYQWAYWCMMFCNVVSPQVFWFKACRRNLIVVFIICNFVNAGMWFERFVIILHLALAGFPALLVAHLSSFLGRDGDVCRHVRHFPLALPALHALPADDRDVGSEDRDAPRPTRIIIPNPPRRGRTTKLWPDAKPKVYGMGAEFPDVAALYHAAEKVRDKEIQILGHPFAILPIHGMDPGDGPRKIVAQRSGACRRHLRPAFRGAAGRLADLV